MGFINDFKNDFKSAWENGKQEARLEVVREFFAYIYGIKYKDAVVSKEWYPSQYEELFNDIMDSGNTVRLRERKELLLDFLEFVTEYMPRNKIDLNKTDGYVQKIIERI